MTSEAMENPTGRVWAGVGAVLAMAGGVVAGGFASFSDEYGGPDKSKGILGHALSSILVGGGTGVLIGLLATRNTVTQNPAQRWDPADWNATEHSHEYFRFGQDAWNIGKAKMILASKPERKLVTFKVIDLRPLAPLVGIDWKRVDRDLEFPVEDQVIKLRVPLIVIVTKYGALPIDGWHRIGKAIRMGVKTLPAVVLTKAEEKAVRLP